ncbi:uncharacterized protein L203_103279 [Cryptococcus depauperatus CBS 7841]|uniref:Uncharacterized protein n=1 Tax=Cryptococcus depauperatus CBS 7841 TaxID=1295531 RepID=A0AAJ8M142_9TREE
MDTLSVVGVSIQITWILARGKDMPIIEPTNPYFVDVWDCARVQHEVVVRRTSAVPSFTTQPTGLLLESLVNISTVVHIPTSRVRAKTSWVANETVKDAYTRLFELENAGLW